MIFIYFAHLNNQVYFWGVQNVKKDINFIKKSLILRTCWHPKVTSFWRVGNNRFNWINSSFNSSMLFNATKYFIGWFDAKWILKIFLREVTIFELSFELIVIFNVVICVKTTFNRILILKTIILQVSDFFNLKSCARLAN